MEDHLYTQALADERSAFHARQRADYEATQREARGKQRERDRFLMGLARGKEGEEGMDTEKERDTDEETNQDNQPRGPSLLTRLSTYKKRLATSLLAQDQDAEEDEKAVWRFLREPLVSEYERGRVLPWRVHYEDPYVLFCFVLCFEDDGVVLWCFVFLFSISTTPPTSHLSLLLTHLYSLTSTYLYPAP